MLKMSDTECDRTGDMPAANPNVELWKSAGCSDSDPAAVMNSAAAVDPGALDLAAGEVANSDLDQLNDNVQDFSEDNLSLEVNFGDGSSCRASDDKSTAVGSGRSSMNPSPSVSSDCKRESEGEAMSDAGDTTPTASETVHSGSSSGNQSDTSVETTTSHAHNRNSLEIRNNIPNLSETKSYGSDTADNSSKLQTSGGVAKIRKKSPGLARRLAESMQVKDRDTSSSERESEPAQIDTTVHSAQRDFESQLKAKSAAAFRNNSSEPKDTNRLPQSKEVENLANQKEKSNSFEKLCDSLLGNTNGSVPKGTDSDTSPEEQDQSKSMEVENEYDYIKYARIQHGDSYVGMRLAYSTSQEPLADEYLGSSREGSPQKVPQPTKQVPVSKVSEDSLTEIPLNGSESATGNDDRNFSLSPEATECDSAEVESVLSDEGKSSTSGMPNVEDGLSSSQGSDAEDGPGPETPADILKRRYRAEIEAGLQGGDTGDNVSSLHSTPSHTSDGSHSKSDDIDLAIRDIKSAIERSKEAARHRGETTNRNVSQEQEPVWVMRDSYVRKIGNHNDLNHVREEYQRHHQGELQQQSEHVFQGEEEAPPEDDSPSKYPFGRHSNKNITGKEYDTDEETDELLDKQYTRSEKVEIPELTQPDEEPDSQSEKRRSRAREVTLRDPNNETVLIEGVLFRARYLGSTQLISEGQPSKALRMMQAQEAVGRIKAPEGENQPSTEVDLFVSIEKIMVLNTDLQEIMMDHALRTISYIADIGDILVIMARRGPVVSHNDSDDPNRKRQTKICCHVFESDEAQLIAQSIGQAFQVAYMEFLKANGIDDPSMFKEIDYQEVLNQQEIFGEELFLFSNKEMQKEVIVPKLKNEPLGVVIVESGWGSMVPTVVLANMSPAGAAARCGQLNIGDQIMSINGVSLVGLPLSSCQTYIKAAKNQTVVKLNVVSCAPVVEVCIKRPDVKYQLGFSVQNGVICSLLRGGIAERGGVRVGHRIIEINTESVVAVPHEKIVKMLATSVGEIHMKTMPTSIFRLLTGQDTPHYI